MRCLRRGAPMCLAVAAALMTSGCFDATWALSVNEDTSGSWRLEVQVHREALAVAAALAEGFDPDSGTDLPAVSAADMEEACRQVLDVHVLADASHPLNPLNRAPEGVTGESESDVSECRVGVTFVWPADAFETVREELLTVEELQPLPGGGWRFELPPEDALLDGGSTSQLDPAMLAGLGVSTPTLMLSLVLPGQPLQHNAHRVSGSTFTWELDLADATPGIFVETTPRTATPSWTWVVVVAVAAGLLVLALLPWWLPRLHRVVVARLFPESDGQSGSLDDDDRSERPPDS